MEFMSDMHVVKDKLAYFDKKYHVSFEVFEQTVKTQQEVYQQWDDYIEWKGYRQVLEDINRKISDINNADFEVN
jgi:hypothetical protein